jgi:DNA-binding XRE family transcriptional regulator
MARDKHAGALIQELREDRGWTPEALSYVIHKIDPRYGVSGRTIRRIEKDGAIPTTRVKFGIAQAFEMVPSQIWSNRVRVPA